MYNAGRWYMTAATSYMARVQDARRTRVWELPHFRDATLVTSMATEMTDLTGPPLGP